MRVVGGLYRHRELLFKSDEVTRPTKDRVKEALFSALGNKTNNSTVLDLFSGSGSLGIEALSRGAKYCYFIDKDKEAVLIIRKNLNNLKIENADVSLLDYLDALNKFKSKNIKFDLVLLDPPYKMDVYKEVITYLMNNNLLNEHAVIVLESDKEIFLDLNANKIKDYNYGKSNIKIIWL